MGMFDRGNPAVLSSVTLDVEELFGCCGVKVIYNLEKYPLATVKQHHKLFATYLRDETSGQENDYYDDGDSEEHEFVNPEGLALVAINNSMYEVWFPILLEAGFALRDQAHNTKTGNNIYTFTKIIHPKE